MQLYNLDEDKEERHNLYHQYPELVRTMKKKLDELQNLKH
jgi:hypothetical protein